MNPVRMMTTTETIDPIFMFMFGACLVLLIGITAAMLYFVVRYHRSRAPEATSDNEGNLWLEIIWTALPTLLVLAMFYYGWSGFLTLRNVPEGAMEVTATARMWSWNFKYPNGASSSRLYVPVGRPVMVNLVSDDVIHGFFLPAFRVKRDIVPGMKNHVWFMAPKAGSYDLYCSLYCGTNHSAMISTVEALPESEFAAWLKREAPGKATAKIDGKKLIEEKGCLGCHPLDGSQGLGPGLKGIMGRSAVVVTNGTERTIVVDEEYLKRSLLEPGADLVKGFPPVMPPIPLKDDELAALLEYMKGLK